MYCDRPALFPPLIQVVPSEAHSRSTHSSRLLSTDLHLSFASVRTPTHSPRDRQLSGQRPSLPLSPFAGHRTSSLDFVLLDVTRSAGYYLEWWTDGSTKPMSHTPPVMDGAKKPNRILWATNLIISMLQSPLAVRESESRTRIYDWSTVNKLSEPRLFDAITIPCMTFRWVSVNDVHDTLTNC